MAVFGIVAGVLLAVSWALLTLFFVKQNVRYPSRFQPVDEIAGLLERLDAGPVTGIPVEVRGTIIGSARRAGGSRPPGAMPKRKRRRRS